MHNRAFVGKKGARHASFCQFSDLQGAIVVQKCLEPLTTFHIRKNRSHMPCGVNLFIIRFEC
jgi:hypothetical protein